MKTNGDNFDDLYRITSDAFGLARRAREQLCDTVIPALPPARRSFAACLGRKLEHATFADESLLYDLDAFIAELERLVMSGTHIGWEADEHHVGGGYEVVYLDESARTLGQSLVALRRLRAAVTQFLDMARAAAIARSLVDR